TSDGVWNPLTFRTNCKAAARISVRVAGGWSATRSFLMLLHIAPRKELLWPDDGIVDLQLVDEAIEWKVMKRRREGAMISDAAAWVGSRIERCKWSNGSRCLSDLRAVKVERHQSRRIVQSGRYMRENSGRNRGFDLDALSSG